VKFTAQWKFEGFNGKTYEPGQELEAKPTEVRHLVAMKYGGEVREAEAALLVPSTIIALEEQLKQKQREMQAALQTEMRSTLKNAMSAEE